MSGEKMSDGLLEGFLTVKEKWVKSLYGYVTGDYDTFEVFDIDVKRLIESVNSKDREMQASLSMINDALFRINLVISTVKDFEEEQNQHLLHAHSERRLEYMKKPRSDDKAPKTTAELMADVDQEVLELRKRVRRCGAAKSYCYNVKDLFQNQLDINKQVLDAHTAESAQVLTKQEVDGIVSRLVGELEQMKHAMMYPANK